MKRHIRPFKCPIPSCQNLGFEYRKCLTRHMDSVHEESPGARRFYCPVETCKHAEVNGKGLARLDNIRRHVRQTHPEIDDSSMF